MTDPYILKSSYFQHAIRNYNVLPHSLVFPAECLKDGMGKTKISFSLLFKKKLVTVQPMVARVPSPLPGLVFNTLIRRVYNLHAVQLSAYVMYL